jgi:excisionase family DNA binding protein
MEEMRQESVLTLAEAASFLRVEEVALAKMAAEGGVPAQKIGEEWRFLKRALVEWLHWGPRSQELFRGFPPPWIMGYPPIEDLVLILEHRLLARLNASEPRAPRRGSKQAVRKHFGIFQDDADIEERLAEIVAQREAGSHKR